MAREKCGAPAGAGWMKEENPHWRSILGSACFIIFAVFGSLVSTSGLIGFIRNDLNLSYSAGGFLLSAPFPLIAFFAVAGGRLVDRLGVKKIVLGGVFFVLLGGVIRLSSGNFWLLALGIALVGVGTGLVFPVMPKVVGTIVPSEHQKFGSAVYTASIIAGAGLGVAASHYMAPVAAVLPAAWGGSVWRGGYLCWALVLVLAFIVWRKNSRAIAEDVGLESTTEKDGMAYRLLAVWAIAGSLFVNNVVFYTSLGWLPTVLTGKGWPQSSAALIVSSLPLLGLFASLTAYKMALVVGGERVMVLLCGLFTAVAFALMPAGNLWVAAVGTAVLGLTTNYWFLFCLAYPAQYVEKSQVGQAAGLIIGMGYLGGFVGPWAIGAIRDWAGSFGPGFYALAGLSVLGICFAPFFGKHTDQR